MSIHGSRVPSCDESVKWKDFSLLALFLSHLYLNSALGFLGQSDALLLLPPQMLISWGSYGLYLRCPRSTMLAIFSCMLFIGFWVCCLRFCFYGDIWSISKKCHHCCCLPRTSTSFLIAEEFSIIWICHNLCNYSFIGQVVFHFSYINRAEMNIFVK